MQPNSTSSEAKAKILLIEDDAVLLRMFQQKLEIDGFEVFTATNGDEGFKKLLETKPNAVLCDIMMPVVTGLQFLEMKRDCGDPEVSAIPVIMLTNLGGEEYEQMARTLGATEFFIKDEDPSSVVTKLKELLSTPETPAAEPTTQPEVAVNPSEDMPKAA